MKKVLRVVFSLTFMGSLAISQLPSSGNCQMMYGSFLAKACALPCCKTNMPKCPFLKATAPRDLIASSVPTFEGSLQPLHTVGLTALPAPRRIVALVSDLVETIRFLIAGPAQAVRAPPTDVHLLAA